MNVDNEHRYFRFLQADDTTDFRLLVTGWLEVAEERAPNEPKALLEGDFLAYLPDGTRLKEVSFKREHQAVGRVLPEWSRSAGRLVGRVVADCLELSDGRRYLIRQVRFVPLSDA